MKVRDVVKLIETAGFRYRYSNGDHHYYEHPDTKVKITVPGHSRNDMLPKTLNSIMKQAGLK